LVVHHNIENKRFLQTTNFGRDAIYDNPIGLTGDRRIVMKEITMQTVLEINECSHNIDKMKKLIRETLSMCRGLINNSSCPEIPHHGFHFTSGDVDWAVHPDWDVKVEKRTNKNIYFVAMSRSKNNLWGTEYWSDSDKFTTIKSVRFVYENLPSFYEGMITIFPELEAKIEQIITVGKDPC